MKEGSPIYPNVKAIWCIENCKKKENGKYTQQQNTVFFQKSCNP